MPPFFIGAHSSRDADRARAPLGGRAARFGPEGSSITADRGGLHPPGGAGARPGAPPHQGRGGMMAHRMLRPAAIAALLGLGLVAAPALAQTAPAPPASLYDP